RAKRVASHSANARPAILPGQTLPDHFLDGSGDTLVGMAGLMPIYCQVGFPAPGTGRQRAALLSHDFMSQQLPHVLQDTSVSRDCKRQILNSYLDGLAEIQGRCEDTPRPSYCADVISGTTTAVRDLFSAFAGSGRLGGLDGHGDEVAACVAASHDPAAALRDIQMSLSLVGRCVQLSYPPGESRVISGDGSDSPTRIEQRYRLTRTGASSYKVEFNLHFTPEEQRAAIETRVRGCLTTSNAALHGENGRTLEMVLNTTDTDIPQKNITVMSSTEHRSNSGEWNPSINCNTITHEMLHLTGLVDEYQEQADGVIYNASTGESRHVSNFGAGAGSGETFLLAQSCRAIGPSNSIMSHQDDAFNEVNNRRRASLLFNGQFDAITQPGCEKNRRYYRCAGYAYQTSANNMGAGCEAGRPESGCSGAAWLQGGDH
ncbi:MAG TPA: hypothetical protein VL588_08980, partial [Bdellovibrionota bacterium]|nr:hypothetical protein [Bdellovibrionota bacterium]